MCYLFKIIVARELVLCLLIIIASSLVYSQNTMTATPEGSFVKGRLMANVDGQYNDVITAGYVFALSADKKQVLGYTTPAKGTLTTGGGVWEIKGLPMNGKVLFVGYASNVHRLCWMQELNLDGKKYYYLGDNTAYMAIPSTSPGEAIGSVLKALYLVGWFVETYQRGKYYQQIDKLTDELEKYREENEKLSIKPNTGTLTGKYRLIEQYGNGKWYKDRSSLYYIFGETKVVLQSESVNSSLPNSAFYKAFSIEHLSPSIIVLSLAGKKMFKLEYVSD